MPCPLCPPSRRSFRSPSPRSTSCWISRLAAIRTSPVSGLAWAPPAPYPPSSHGRAARSPRRGEPPAPAPARVGGAGRPAAAAPPAWLPGARPGLGLARAASRRRRPPRVRVGRARARRVRVDRPRRLLPLRGLRRRRRLRGAPPRRTGRAARALDGRQRGTPLLGHRARARPGARPDRGPRSAGLAARGGAAAARGLDQRSRADHGQRAARPDPRRGGGEAAPLLPAHRGDLAAPGAARHASDRRGRAGRVEVGPAARDALAAAVLHRAGTHLLGPRQPHRCSTSRARAAISAPRSSTSSSAWRRCVPSA